MPYLISGLQDGQEPDSIREVPEGYNKRRFDEHYVESAPPGWVWDEKLGRLIDPASDVTAQAQKDSIDALKKRLLIEEEFEKGVSQLFPYGLVEAILLASKTPKDPKLAQLSDLFYLMKDAKEQLKVNKEKV